MELWHPTIDVAPYAPDSSAAGAPGRASPAPESAVFGKQEGTMHVALYLKHFPPSGSPLRGGTAVAVDGLASGLSQIGAEVSVLCEGAERSSLRAAGGYAIECFPGRGPHRTFKVSPELERYAERRLASRRAVCLVNGMFHPAAYAMARILRRQGIPYVAVPHSRYDDAVFRKNAHLKWPYWYFFERYLLRRAGAIQVLDASHAAGLQRLGVDTAIIEAPNGVAPGSVPDESELRWRAPADRVKLVFFGRIDAYTKGLDILLEAFMRIGARAAMTLTMQGPGDRDRGQLERRAAALAVSDRVIFRAADYDRPAPQILADYDVVCLPSRYEGFGIAALEAMLAGRVLLVSERAGISRHVAASGCGIIVRPTVAGVEEGLLALLRRRDEWREMGMSGRRYALANLQWKDIAAAALRHYVRLAA